MKSPLSTALIALALVSPAANLAQAQGAGPASHNPATVQMGSYKVEPGHTQVMFSVLHMGFSEYSGVFSGASGSMQIDPAHLGATRLQVSVPVASVSTTSPKLDGELKGATWLDAGQYPDMSFRSSKVTPEGGDRARIDGDLTLHGVTRPLTLEARFVGAGVNPMNKTYTMGFEATGQLSRSAFGVKTYVPLISDAVTLRIAGAFEKTN